MTLKRVLRYLKGTKKLKLKYECKTKQGEETKGGEENNILYGYVDADWGSDTEDRKSTSGYIFYVFGCPVSWASKKQTTVALSSSEAEYVALSSATSEGLWIKGILEDMSVMTTEDSFILYEDNQGCIQMAKNTETKRTKHIDIKHHFIRDNLLKRKLQINHVSSIHQVADIFTKSLDKCKFVAIRNYLDLSN